MVKKIIKLFCCVALFTTSIIGLSACDSTDSVQGDSTTSEEVVDTIVQLALDEADIRLEDYIDINYFSNLQISTKEMVDSIQTLSLSSEQNEILDIDDEQYIALTNSITNIFKDLSTEEYEVFKTLADDDTDIADMLQMIENGFDLSTNEALSSVVKNANIVKLSAGVMTITTILSGQEVCTAAIIAIKGAFNSMIATLKAFFVPNTVKGIIITAAILVIATVVVVNWNKIKPVFNQIVNVFVDNAKKLASTVTRVFNNIYQTAKTSEKSKDVADDATSQNQMQKQVERGQAPKEVDRVDKDHTGYGQEHVHFKDGTAINKDGTIHDDGKGVPNLSKKVLDWLNKNGWCLNGLKN